MEAGALPRLCAPRTETYLSVILLLMTSFLDFYSALAQRLRADYNNKGKDCI